VTPAWWTDADEAELDVLVNAFVGAACAHKACVRCRELNTWCPPMISAFEAVLEWRRSRQLRSRAEWLRARENQRAAA
jgi:hypothetical protein